MHDVDVILLTGIALNDLVLTFDLDLNRTERTGGYAASTANSEVCDAVC